MHFTSSAQHRQTFALQVQPHQLAVQPFALQVQPFALQGQQPPGAATRVWNNWWDPDEDIVLDGLVFALS